jgi:hypothetical protein
MVAGARIDCPENQHVPDNELIDRVTETLTITRAEFKNDAAGKMGVEIVHLVYLDNPMPPARVRDWEKAVSKIRVPTLNGTGHAINGAVVCSYCQSREHRQLGCEIRNRPGWFDTEALAAAAVPGQNVRPARLTPGVSEDRGRRGRPGRARGRGNRARG